MTEHEQNILITAHLPICRKCALTIARQTGLDPDDLYEEAVVRLWKASLKWQPERGEFGQVAWWYVRAYVRHKADTLVRERSRLVELGDPEDAASVASALMEAQEPPENMISRREVCRAVLAVLHARERIVFAYHYGWFGLPRLTFNEIGARLGMTGAGVHRIEKAARRKLTALAQPGRRLEWVRSSL